MGRIRAPGEFSWVANSLFFIFFSIDVSVFPCFPQFSITFPSTVGWFPLVSTVSVACRHASNGFVIRWHLDLGPSSLWTRKTILALELLEVPSRQVTSGYLRSTLVILGIKSTTQVILGYLRLSQVNISFVYSFVYRCIIDVSLIYRIVVQAADLQQSECFAGSVFKMPERGTQCLRLKPLPRIARA